MIARAHAHHFRRPGSAPRPSGSKPAVASGHSQRNPTAIKRLPRHGHRASGAPKSPAMLPSRCLGGVTLGSQVGRPAAQTTRLATRPRLTRAARAETPAPAKDLDARAAMAARSRAHKHRLSMEWFGSAQCNQQSACCDLPRSRSDARVLRGVSLHPPKLACIARWPQEHEECEDWEQTRRSRPQTAAHCVPRAAISSTSLAPVADCTGQNCNCLSKTRASGHRMVLIIINHQSATATLPPPASTAQHGTNSAQGAAMPMRSLRAAASLGSNQCDSAAHKARPDPTGVPHSRAQVVRMAGSTALLVPVMRPPRSGTSSQSGRQLTAPSGATAVG